MWRPFIGSYGVWPLLTDGLAAQRGIVLAPSFSNGFLHGLDLDLSCRVEKPRQCVIVLMQAFSSEQV